MRNLSWRWKLLLLSCPAWVGACLAGEPVGQGLGPAAVRWYPTREALDRLVPSHALQARPVASKPVPEGFDIKPVYGKAETRATARIVIPEGASLYGVGREPGALLRNGQNFGGVPVGTPWVLCVKADGKAFGVFADTTYATGVDLTKDILFTSDDPALPIVVLQADSAQELLVQLNEMTGRMEMPALWTLGYQQFSAFSDIQLRHAARWLREAKIPAGSLWLNVPPPSWPLTYTPEYVPDLKALAEEMKGKGFHVIGGIGRVVPDSRLSVLAGPGKAEGHFLRYEDGNLYSIEVGEDQVLCPDFARKETRAWWSGLVGKFLEPGLDGVMCIRWSPERLAATVHVRADDALGGPGNALRYQEVMDTQFARATWEGFDGEKVNRRPFVMVDARAIGAQRWTGALIDWPEKDPDWPRIFLAAALNTSMSGQPFLGTIVKPPFQGEGSEPNLRWIGVAATFPVTFGSFFLPEDLATFPAEAQKTIRQAMERRSRLIPYIYTQCFGAFFSCEPILRPLFFDDPTDPALRSSVAGFLVGKDLLVVPRFEDGPRPKVPLKGAWKRLDFGDSENEWLPDLYIRPGTVIPLGPVMQYPDEKPLDPVTIVANPDESGMAEGFIYEDRGEGFEFYKNQARRVGYRITKQDGAYMVRLSRLDFGIPLPTRKMEVRIITETGELTGSGSEKGTIKIDIPVAPPPEKR